MDIIASYGRSDDEEDAQLTHDPEQNHSRLPSSTSQEDVALHQGRTRSFPHIDGNFATHVYTNVHVQPQYKPALENLFQILQQAIPNLKPVVDSLGNEPIIKKSDGDKDSGAASSFQLLLQKQYHVSFSRTVPIRLEQSDALLAELKEQLRKTPPFRIHIQGLELFLNDDKTRTFIALTASSSSTNTTEHQQPTSVANDELITAINAVSKAFHYNGLPKFYSNPRPHISIAWLLGNHLEAISALLTSCEELKEAEKRVRELNWSFEVEKIVCRIGQKEFSVWRPSRRV